MSDSNPTNQREAILTAAAQLFQDVGFRAATTKRIAKEAGVSEGALYYHFADKRELLLCTLDHSMSQLRGDVVTVGSEPRSLRQKYKELTEQRVRQAQPQIDTILGLLSEVMADRELGQEAYRRVIAPSVRGMEALLEAHAAELRSGNIDRSLVARIFVAVGLGLDVLHHMGDESLDTALRDPERLAETLSALLFDGLTNS